MVHENVPVLTLFSFYELIVLKICSYCEAKSTSITKYLQQKQEHKTLTT